jgi:hypothetical protein
VYGYYSSPGSIFQTIIVTVTPDCSIVSLTGDLIANITYDLSELAERVIVKP